MQNILSQKSQYAEGNLNRVISKMSYSKMIKLRKTVFSEDGFLISFEVIVDLDFQGAPYAKFLDKSESKNPNSYALFSSRRNIVQNLARWMHQKKASGSFNSSVDVSTKKKFNKFLFFLVKKKLADNRVTNQSNFIETAKAKSQLAVDAGTDNFVNYLGAQIALEHITTLNKTKFF